MSNLCFTSVWATGKPLQSHGIRKSVCSSRMSLVSHEKLETVFGNDDEGIATYKLELEIPGTYSREMRKQSVASLKKNSQFKGFRKGTIPPFIYKDIDGFVFQDSVNSIINEAVTELGLEPIEGEASEPDMDIDDMKSRFKVGQDFAFSCTLPLEKKSKLDSNAFVDAEATEVKELAQDIAQDDAKDVEDAVVAST